MADVEKGDGVAVGTAGDVVFMLWRDPARMERIVWFNGHLHRAMAANPGGIIGVQLIMPTSSPPDAAARAKAAEFLADPALKVRKMVTIALGDGLWQSLVRTIMRGMLMMNRQKNPGVVVATEDEGLAEVAKLATPATPPRDILRLRIAELYKTLDITR